MKQRILLSRIVFIILWITVVFFYVFSSSYTALFLFYFFICLTIVTCIYGILIKDKVEIDIMSQAIAKKRTNSSMTIQLKNKSFLPLPYICCTLLIQNKLTNEITKEEFTTSLFSYATKNISFQIYSEHCGKIDIKVKNIRVQDLFRLFKRNTTPNAGTEIVYMPTVVEGNVDDVYATREMAEAAIFFSERKGDLQEEMIALKEYVPGDHVKQIHWKLSSKLDELMIKELADVREERIVLLLETSLNMEDSGEQINTIDQMMDTFASLLQYFVEEEKQIYVGWYDEGIKQLQMEQMYGKDAMGRIIRETLSVPRGDFKATSYEAYIQKEHESVIVYHVTTKYNKQSIKENIQTNYIPIIAEDWLEQSKQSMNKGAV